MTNQPDDAPTTDDATPAANDAPSRFVDTDWDHLVIEEGTGRPPEDES